MTRIEKGQTPEQLFDTTKLTIQRNLLTGPLIPKRQQAEMRELLGQRMSLLPDDEFLREARMSAVTGFSEEDEAHFRDHIDRIQAMYIPGFVVSGQSSIIIRETAAEAMVGRPYGFLGMTLEELGHAYTAPQPEVPLLDVPLTSLRLAGYESSEAIEAHLLELRELFHLPSEYIDLSRIQLATSGFSTVMREVPDDSSEEIFYSPNERQLALEETRAGMVQTVFAAKVHGSLKRPFGTLGQQLEVGLHDLDTRSEYHMDSHEVQSLGLTLVTTYLRDSRNIADGAQELLQRLYSSNVDEFTSYLATRKPLTAEIFNIVVDFYAGVLTRMPNETLNN